MECIEESCPKRMIHCWLLMLEARTAIPLARFTINMHGSNNHLGNRTAMQGVCIALIFETNIK